MPKEAKVKYSELSSKSRSSPHWIKFAAASLMVAAIAGCGGGGTGANTPVAATTNATAATAASAAAWQALAPQITITSASVPATGTPVIQFMVKDAAGNPVVGLGNRTQSATATVSNLSNMSFTLAKLVPGTAPNGSVAGTGEPRKGVSYDVLRPVNVAEAGGTVAATASCNDVAAVGTAPAVAPTWCGTYPTTDNQGTLVDNKDGTYQYTFYRDPKQVAALAATLNDTANGLNKKADLGDLTYNANLTHRVGIIVSGNAPGSGTNTPNGVSLGVASAAMVNPGNAVYDFIPATGAKAVEGTDATRNIVNINTCASCHQSKGLAHGGSRKDPKLCVTCHTDQVKYSFNMGNAPMADGITFDAPASTATTQEKRAIQAILDGRAVGNMPNYMHKIHMGSNLVKQGYNYNNDGGAMQFNINKYPQDIRNCTTCHDGDATDPTKKTFDGNNWKTQVNALACGSCHDGISFTTGLGSTLADKKADVLAKVAIGTTKSGHKGGVMADNSKCTTCHAPADIPVYHGNVAAVVTPTAGTVALPRSPIPATASAALRTMSATINSVVVDANGGVTANFSVKDAGVAVTDPTKFAIVGFSLAKLVPAANGASSQWVSYTSRFRTKIATQEPTLQGNKEPGESVALPGTLTANADSSFSYKFALLNASTPGDIRTIDHAHVLRQAGNPTADTTLNGWTFNATTKKWTGPANAAGTPAAEGTGWNVVAYEPTLTHRVAMEFTTNPAPKVDNAANAYKDFVPGVDGLGTGTVATTRNIVTMDNCSTCHAGVKLHEGYTTQLCVTCHNATAGDPYNGKSIDLQNVVHKIHQLGADYTISNGFFGSASPNKGFPGLVKNCQACHVETNAAAKDAANWRTMPNSHSCATCHTSTVAVAHMNAQISGGTVSDKVAVGLKEGGVETCTLCHGPASTLGVDVKTVHSKNSPVVTGGNDASK